jgi:hypothetical protein
MLPTEKEVETAGNNWKQLETTGNRPFPNLPFVPVICNLPWNVFKRLVVVSMRYQASTVGTWQE